MHKLDSSQLIQIIVHIFISSLQYIQYYMTWTNQTAFIVKRLALNQTILITQWVPQFQINILIKFIIISNDTYVIYALHKTLMMFVVTTCIKIIQTNKNYICIHLYMHHSVFLREAHDFEVNFFKHNNQTIWRSSMVNNISSIT